MIVAVFVKLAQVYCCTIPVAFSSALKWAAIVPGDASREVSRSASIGCNSFVAGADEAVIKGAVFRQAILIDLALICRNGQSDILGADVVDACLFSRWASAVIAARVSIFSLIRSACRISANEVYGDVCDCYSRMHGVTNKINLNSAIDNALSFSHLKEYAINIITGNSLLNPCKAYVFALEHGADTLFQEEFLGDCRAKA